MPPPDESRRRRYRDHIEKKYQLKMFTENVDRGEEIAPGKRNVMTKKLL